MAVMRWLAALGGRSWFLDGIAMQVATSYLYRSLPYVTILSAYWAAAWSEGRSGRVRRTVAAAFLIAFVAGALSRVVQNAWVTPRPVYDPVLGRLFAPTFQSAIDHDFHSFPSDHAAFLLPLVWYVGRLHGWLGGAAGVLLSLGMLSRVYLGVHYPVDVVVGLGLGALVIVLVERFWPTLPDRACTLVRACEARWPRAVAALLFLVAYAYATMFDDLRRMGLALLRAYAHL